jgi:hypothetical protein
MSTNDTNNVDNNELTAAVLLTQDSPIISTPTKKLQTEGKPVELGFNSFQAIRVFALHITPIFTSN